jgi:hypothetical protein
MADTQSFKNHRRVSPLYHLFTLPILIANVVVTIIRLWRAPSFGTVLGVLVALALVGLAISVRQFALTLQNRVIRLEMRLRLVALLPGELHARVPDLTLDQLIALRFASDAELPGLVRKVLDEGTARRRTIKQMVADWQADHLRV